METAHVDFILTDKQILNSERHLHIFVLIPNPNTNKSNATDVMKRLVSAFTRKLIVPQKEPSPLLDKKIEELEAKFADMTDEELEDLGDDDGDTSDAQSMPQLQTPLVSDLDMMPYTPPQVSVVPLQWPFQLIYLII